MLRVEVFQCSTSVGLAMHITDVIVDELRRCTATHQFPSLILAVLFAVPFRAMAAADVVQIERRVQILVVQPIAGGIFEKYFMPTPKQRKAEADVDNDGSDSGGGSSDDDDEDAAAAQQTASQRAAIAKSVVLSEAVALLLKQIGLDPRSKFLMRPLLEEASRSVSGYVLIRTKPTEYARVTAADKRKMLAEAVHQAMFNAKSKVDTDPRALKRAKRKDKRRTAFKIAEAKAAGADDAAAAKAGAAPAGKKRKGGKNKKAAAGKKNADGEKAKVLHHRRRRIAKKKGK